MSRRFLLLIILLSAPAFALDLRTGDDLVISFDERGSVSSVKADGRRISPQEAAGGFYIAEYRYAPEEERVQGGDFEDRLPGAVTGGWQRDTTQAHDGGASLALLVPEGGEYTLQFPLEPLSTYQITFYLRSADLEGTPILHLRRRDANGRLLGQQANFQYIGIYHPNWVRIQHTFQTLPETAEGELMLHVPRGKAGNIWVDDLSVRKLAQPELHPLPGQLARIKDGARFRAEWNNLTVEADLFGGPDGIHVSGTLQDLTGRDRAIQLAFRIPVDAEGWTWGDGLESARRIKADRTYLIPKEIGRDTNRYISKWPYASIWGNRVGLSIGNRMDRPAVYRHLYDGDFSIQYDFGLTGDAERLPSQAPFAFVVYRHDPAWGLRSTAKRYFTMFAEQFQVRTAPGNVLSNRHAGRVEGLRNFGAMYADRHFGDYGLIKEAEDQSLVTMTYNEPWMWRSNFGGISQTQLPTFEDIITRERKDIDAWDRNDETDYHTSPRAYSVRAFLNSVYHDENGRPIINGTRTYGGGRYRVVEWLTNADPDIVGSLGQPNRGLQSWKYEYGLDVEGARKLGATANGIRYDSLGEWTHLGVENHRRGHFAFADYPLTFSYRTGRPCQLGYFGALEYLRFVRGKMLERDGFTCANGDAIVPWFAPLLDGVFRENWSPEMESYRVVRMLMFQKNCGDWGRARMSHSNEQLEQTLNDCLTYAWWPGIDGRPGEWDARRSLFKRYVPVLEELSNAGWEPVTYASAGSEDVLVERFGGEGTRPLYFAVRNLGDAPRDVALDIDAGPLGRTVTAVSDPLGETTPVLRNSGVTFALRSGRTAVLRVE